MKKSKQTVRRCVLQKNLDEKGMGFTMRKFLTLNLQTSLTLRFTASALLLSLMLAFVPAISVSTSALTSGDYNYTVSNGKATITKYNGSATILVIPSKINGFPVTAIGKSAFDSTALESITFPDSLISIGDSAFEMSGLKKVTFGNGLKSIGRGAFASCSFNGINLVLPDGLETIGDSAFWDAIPSQVTIQNSVTFIGAKAFSTHWFGDKDEGDLPTVIVCSKGSYAQKYAEKNSLSFKLLGQRPIKYTVKFSKNNKKAAGKMKNQALTYGMRKKLSNLKFKRTGYDFIGWNTKKNGKGKHYSAQATLQTLTDQNGKAITLHAQWIKKSKVGNVKSLTLAATKGNTIAISFEKVPGAEGYEAVYARDKSFKKSSKKRTSKRLSMTISGLKEGKTYYLKARAFKKNRSGKRMYSPKFSSVLKFTLPQRRK
ncbi:MAG: leucine-rich repeat protein [Oscillospiraceae bacterium]|nr:leucine-rich repeat protein [Oscillospiraceae bacterium]